MIAQPPLLWEEGYTRGSRLRQELRHCGGPFVLGFEDYFDNFANRAAASGGASDVGGAGKHFRISIGDRDRKADAGEDWNVLNIVADVTDPVGGRPGFRSEERRVGKECRL